MSPGLPLARAGPSLPMPRPVDDGSPSRPLDPCPWPNRPVPPHPPEEMNKERKSLLSREAQEAEPVGPREGRVQLGFLPRGSTPPPRAPLPCGHSRHEIPAPTPGDPPPPQWMEAGLGKGPRSGSVLPAHSLTHSSQRYCLGGWVAQGRGAPPRTEPWPLGSMSSDGRDRPGHGWRSQLDASPICRGGGGRRRRPFRRVWPSMSLSMGTRGPGRGWGVTCTCLAGVGAASHAWLLSGVPGAPSSFSHAPTSMVTLLSTSHGEGADVRRLGGKSLWAERRASESGGTGEKPGWARAERRVLGLDSSPRAPEQAGRSFPSARGMGAVAPGWRRQATRRLSRPFGPLLPGAAGGHQAPVLSQMTAVDPRELCQAAQGTGQGTEAPCCGFLRAGSGTPVGAPGAGVWAQVHRPVHTRRPDLRPTVPAPPRTPRSVSHPALEVEGGPRLSLARSCPPLTAWICVQLPGTRRRA